MTERELNAAMRRVLLDSVERRMRAVDWESLPPLSPSPRHEAQMRAMLKNPLKWADRRERPVWKTVLLRAAMFLLALMISLSVLTLSIPAARAAFVRWFIEWWDATHWAYRYTGQVYPDEMPKYEITALPEGFVEVESERFETPTSISIVYENAAGEVIYFDYNFMHDGTYSFYSSENYDVYEITINQMYGLYMESKIPGNWNGITWIDEEANIHFDITGAFDRDSILHIAESVSLVEMPK